VNDFPPSNNADGIDPDSNVPNNPPLQPDWQRWELEHGFPQSGPELEPAARPAPVDVETARHLWWGVALIGAISALYSVWTLFGARAEFAQSLLDDLAAQGAAADMTVESTQSMVTVMLVVTLFVVAGFGALFLFWVKRMRAGKMWARMLLTIIGSITVFTTILDLFAIASSTGAMNIVMSVLSIGQGVLAAGAILLMHRKESNEYFLSSRKR
jgi:magnesium-transporting ATPase (P-type)